MARRRRSIFRWGRARDPVAPAPSAAVVGGSRTAQLVLAAVFVLPALALYAVFELYPFLTAIYYSLTSWDGASAEKNFIGLDNYSRLLRDDLMWTALRHNVVWVVVGTIAPIVIGYVLAVLLWSGSRSVLLFRTLFFMPFVLPTVVIATIWGWIYDPLFGVLNGALGRIGLESLARGWLGDPNTALIAVLVAAIWATYGFVVVVLLTGLQNVSTDLIDASVMDGANWYRRQRHVVLPGIAPVLTMVTTVTLIGGFSVFDIVFVMTGGGPGTSTELLATYTYKSAFNLNEVGYGAALSMVITALSLVTAVAFVRLRERAHRAAHG